MADHGTLFDDPRFFVLRASFVIHPEPRTRNEEPRTGAARGSPPQRVDQFVQLVAQGLHVGIAEGRVEGADSVADWMEKRKPLCLSGFVCHPSASHTLRSRSRPVLWLHRSGKSRGDAPLDGVFLRAESFVSVPVGLVKSAGELGGHFGF